MNDHEEAKRAATDWVQKRAARLAAVDTPAALGKLTEELNEHLQAVGVVPVTLPCGCCVLLGLEFRPIPTPFGLGYEIRPIRRPAARDVH